MTGYRGPFKILWWKWYLVDLRDFHNPRVVRKHLNDAKQARLWRKTYFNRHYSVVSGKEVKHYKIFFLVKPKPGLMHIESKNPKYIYPEGCETDYDKKLFRNKQRYLMRKQKKTLPTKIDVWNILENKPILFLTRMKKLKDDHFVMSRGAIQISRLKKDNNFQDLVKLHIIVRTLVTYEYNRSFWSHAQIAKVIYRMWKPRIDKRLKYPNIKDPKKIIQEFKSRGFIPLSETGFDPKKDHYVCTNKIVPGPTLVYPIKCSHAFGNEYHSKEYYVYDLLPKVGIPGYTRAHVAGLDKRR